MRSHRVWYAIIVSYVCGVVISVATVVYVDQRDSAIRADMCSALRSAERELRDVLLAEPDNGTVRALLGPIGDAEIRLCR